MDAIQRTRAALDVLPKIFLKNDFAMNNKHTFSSVFSLGESTRDIGAAESRYMNALYTII